MWHLGEKMWEFLSSDALPLPLLKHIKGSSETDHKYLLPHFLYVFRDYSRPCSNSHPRTTLCCLSICGIVCLSDKFRPKSVSFFCNYKNKWCQTQLNVPACSFINCETMSTSLPYCFLSYCNQQSRPEA